MGKKVVIVDYQLGNLFSVKQVLDNINLDVTISSDPSDITAADAIILPGVGAFKDAMDNLHSMGLVEPIKHFISSGRPFLGICLGLQLLFTNSEEFGSAEGLNVIHGKVKRFANRNVKGQVVKVPQIAWNGIQMASPGAWINTPLKDTVEYADMYFVHSFYVVPEDESVILTTTDYGGVTYASSIWKDNIFACQFHPEKSGNKGINIYKNWAVINNLF